MNFKDYFPLYKKNLVLAGPVVLSQIGMISVSLVDNMMVGHVGTTELAAAAFATNVLILGLFLGMGICMGITPLVGQVFSQKNQDAIGSYLKNGVLVQLLSSFIIIIIMGVVGLFLHTMGQAPDVVIEARPYYFLLVVSLLPALLFHSFKQFLEGVGNTRIAMYITLSSNVVNIILNYLLIFGKFGFPELGLLGAGWATLIARIIMPMLLVPFVAKNEVYRNMFAVAFRSSISLSRMKEILSVGIPIGLQLVVEVTTFAAGAVMMGWLGEVSLAAHQIALSLASITYMISLGVSSGTTINVSHEFGIHNLKKLKQTVYASLHIVVTFMAIMGIVFVLLRNQLPTLFTEDIDVVLIASILLIVAALFQIFDGVQVVLLGALRGLSDVSVPMLMAFFSYSVVGLPVSYLFAFIFKLGAVGIWIGFLVGLGLAAILFSMRFKKLLHSYV